MRTGKFGAARVVVLFGVKEPSLPRAEAPEVPKLLAPWNAFGPDYRRLLLAVLVFTPGNSTDAFLLLRLIPLVH